MNIIRQLVLACGFAVVLTACGGGGGGGSPSAPPVAVVPAPTVAVALAASKTPVGGTNTLTWTSTNATSCAISGAMTAAGLGANSSQTLSPTAGGQFKYTVTCTGAGGSAVADATMITDSFTTVIAAKSPNASAQVGEPANRTVELGEYTYNTGFWGINAASAYSQTQTGSVDFVNKTANMKAEWDITSSATPGIVNFVNVTYGKHPGWTKSTTTALPVQIASMPAITVTGDIGTVCLTVCGFQTVFDVFVMETPNATPTEVGLEILIHTIYSGDGPDNPYMTQFNVGSVVSNGIIFQAYYNSFGTGLPGNWTNLVFLPPKNTSFTNTNLDMKQFINFAAAKGYVKSTDYLVSIELGTEVAVGKGITTVSNLKIQ